MFVLLKPTRLQLLLRRGILVVSYIHVGHGGIIRSIIVRGRAAVTVAINCLHVRIWLACGSTRRRALHMRCGRWRGRRLHLFTTP